MYPDVGTCDRGRPAMTGVLLAFVLGLTLPSARAADPDQVRHAVQTVQEMYGDQLDAETLYQAALEGIAAELDRTTGRPGHAVFDVAERTAVEAWLDGQRSGIAAEFTVIPGQGIIITDIYPDGPAEKAGLQVGDLVVAIDDHPFTGLPSELILGIAATPRSPEVVLDIRRPEGLRRVPVSRGVWRLDTARSFDHHGSRVLKLPFFGPGSAQAVQTALSDLPVDAPLIIDLRTNEGGRLEAMLKVAALFVAKDTTVAMVDEGQAQPRIHRAPAGAEARWTGALCVLTDRDTSGTAEAFAAALRHQRGAILVGTPTAGRDGLPRQVALDGGLTLQVVDHRLLDPRGMSWASSGLVPDILSQSVTHTMPVQTGALPPDIQLDVAVQVIDRQGREAGSP